MRLIAWIVRAIVAVLLLSAGVQAAYKPVDISDITGEKRKALEDLWAELKRMPPMARECYICEQLGLTFSKDYSQVLSSSGGHPGTTNKEKAYFVGRGGKPIRWVDAVNEGHERWSKCYNATKQFKAEAPLVPFKKEVQKVVRNTARYLLKNLPKEHRWLILAFMGDMVYNHQGPYDRGRGIWAMGNGIGCKAPWQDISDHFFLDPEGKEHDVHKVFYTYDNARRWRFTIWRCENLVGSKDILALFSEEVEAMRKHYKARDAQLKDEAKAKNDALLVAADEAMSSLPREKRLARIALAMGLYYLDHREAGCADGHLNPNATIILPDGSEHSGEEFVDEAPGLLQQVPHEAILEFYRQPIEQMARAVAKERFGEMPPVLRDLLRARLSRKLINLDGSPAKIKEGTGTIQTFDRAWKVPMDAVDREHTYFLNSAGQKLPYSIYNTYERDYAQTLVLVNLCAQILGKEETVKLIPPGNVETKVDDTASDSTGSTTAETVSIPPDQTALGNTSREVSDAPQDKLSAQGQTALRGMPAERRCAWLAEGMGLCFTEDGGKAYQSERTANGNAVYVDALGRVCKLSDVPGKDSPEWTAATNAARIVGYEKLTVPCKREIQESAVRTCKRILTSMPPGLRQSWLAERNGLFFMPNAGVSRKRTDWDLESGIRVSFQGTCAYEKCLYFDPDGKIMSATNPGEEWINRWRLLYYCETMVGIEAINRSVSKEVKAMRDAFQKSPFYAK